MIKAIGFLVGLLALAAPALAQGKLPKTATPAIWTIKDQGADVTIMGSIHLLPPGLTWRTPAIEAAFKKAEIVVFEAPVDGGMGESSVVMARLGQLKGGETLSKVVPKPLWERIEKAAWKVKFPAKNLEPFEPWMAAVTLEVMNYIDKGFSPWLGVDMVLEGEAETAGKKLQYLETIEEQLGFLAGMPRKYGVKMLELTVEGIETKPNLVFDLVNAWAKGDPKALWKLAEAGMDALPELEDALLTRRNKNWVPKIEAMAKTGKPHFVVVGAAHMAGPNSVITLLRANGWKIEGP